jgi:hypothetical protein
MLKIEKINALSELDRYGWKYTPTGPSEVKCLCPVHSEQTPSLSLNTEKNVWICHASSCGAKGDIIALLAYIGECERKTVIADLMSRYQDIGAKKVINQQRIETYHRAIWKSGPFLQQLYNRGVTDTDIRSARLGYHDGRIMIPVPDTSGNIINIRKYKPGAPSQEKFRNIRGYTTKTLYQIDQLKYPTIWICGGEIKALVAKRFLEPNSIGAIAVTAGEGAWEPEFTTMLKDKHVFLCMDIDEGGRAAAKKVASYVLGTASSVRIIELPLDKAVHPKGDLNDWVAEGAKTKDFLAAMETAVEFTTPIGLEKDMEVLECRLRSAARAENVGRPIQCKTSISAADEVPYIVPKTVHVSCTKDQPFCNTCQVKSGTPDPDTGLILVQLKPSNAGLLGLIQTSKRNMKLGILEAFGAVNCKVAEIFPDTFYNISDVRLTSPLELDGDNREHIVQPAYILTDRFLDLNTPYLITGRPYPHPTTSQAVLLVDQVEDLEDSLASCTFTKEDVEALQIFQPSEWTVEAVESKLDDIYEDMSNNVTRIFYRKDLHLAVDLVYHSSLYFSFENRIQNGWVNGLITGDSSQGKSEVSIRLIDHYGLGTRHDCKNASEAGLLGGLQQIGTRWFVTWGVIPIYDRQLVVLEEIKGASPAALGSLTDMRSSGEAQITKIERRRAHARTRLLMISNPRSDRPISAYNYGVESLKELMGSLEDTRRFDFALIVSEQEIKTALINAAIRNKKIGNPLYTAELCRKNVLWAWTRTSEQIHFEADAEEACLVNALYLCERYTETVPICDKGTMRYKLARLAISMANKTQSVMGNTTIVRECHVVAVKNFLVRNYDSPYSGYRAFSEAEEYTSKLKDPHLVRRQIAATKYPKDLVEQLLHSETIMPSDICDWCEVGREMGQRILSLFVRKRALFREKMQYVKSSGFIDLLKQMLKEGIAEQATTEGEDF